MWMNGDRYPNEEDWSKLEDLFDSVLALDSLSREAFVEVANGSGALTAPSPTPFTTWWSACQPGAVSRDSSPVAPASADWHYWGNESLNTAEVCS
jgi:hypothetical protein